MSRVSWHGTSLDPFVFRSFSNANGLHEFSVPLAVRNLASYMKLGLVRNLTISLK
jgi:hypothetical protein